MTEKLEKWFHLKELGTTPQREVIAGITTFLSMAYILAVNPSILGTVMNANGVFVATALASAIATFVMGILANYPIALSSGMGLNAYFAFTVCLGELQGDPNAFKICLAAVFVEGIIFIIFSLFKFRERIINVIPKNLKYGVSAGIGLFVALIGLVNAGVTVNDDSTLITIGNFKSASMSLCLIGLLIMLLLIHKKIPGAVLLGVFITWVLGMIAQLTGWYDGNVFPDFTNGFGLSGITETAFKLDFGWAFSHITQFIAITFSFLFVDIFDTVGTVVGVADKANLLDKDGNLPRVKQVFLADAIGTTVGSLLGTSTVTSFVESSAGVAAGGRSGLTAITTGFMFLLALIFSPIFLAIPGFATAPALIYVGMLMVSSLKNVDFEADIADVSGAYLAFLIMPLTYSISNGIMIGIMAWVILKVIIGKVKEIDPIMWIIFALFVLRIIAIIFNFQ